MLKIRKLSAGYPEKQVIQDLDLYLQPGTVTVILGPNGSGKSTLLKALAGLLPASGEILLAGTPMGQMTSRERAKGLSYLPQSRPIPEITAGKLVLHGRFPYLSFPRSYRPEDLAAARHAMEQMGIAHLENRLVSRLSGGERQKCYVAMMLAQGTPVLLMDEPTGYLDISHKFELMDTVRQLARQGKTLLLVLHDLDLALRYADRLAVLDQGTLGFFGTVEEVLASGVLESVFRIRIGTADTDAGPQYYFLPQR